MPTFLPDPAAPRRDAAARWQRLVRDGGIAVATVVAEDEAHLDGAFIGCAGDAEGQTGACVPPDRRSGKQTL